jgi:hypothetical protein
MQGREKSPLAAPPRSVKVLVNQEPEPMKRQFRGTEIAPAHASDVIPLPPTRIADVNAAVDRRRRQ